MKQYSGDESPCSLWCRRTTNTCSYIWWHPSPDPRAPIPWPAQLVQWQDCHWALDSLTSLSMAVKTQSCYWALFLFTILSLSLGAIYNLVIEPCCHLQPCHWAQEPFTILSLSLGIIYNPAIEPRNHLQSCHWALFLFTILSLSLRTIYRAHLLLPDQGSSFICAWWQCILQFWGCRLPQGLPTAYTSCGMYSMYQRVYTVNFSVIPFDPYFVYTMKCVSCMCLKIANGMHW